MKRPSAVKIEPPSPRVKKPKPEKATCPAETAPPKPEKALPSQPEEKGDSKPEEAQNKKPEEAKKAKPEEAKITETRKPAQTPSETTESLPPVNKRPWGDVKYQCQSLAKKGQDYLLNAWKEAQSGGHQSKREFYYHVFLLDPNVAKKEVHKESLQRHTTTNTTVKGWMTKWQIGKLEGGSPVLPGFESLCDSAVEGLPSRRHENEGLARQGVMQYYFEKELAQEEKEQNESLTKAKQTAEQLDTEVFQQVEDKLQVKPGTKQLTLGGTKPENSAETKAKKLQGLYTECLEKCKKLDIDFNKSLEMLEELLTVFEQENARKSSASLTAMHEELKSLEKSLDGKKKAL